MKQANEKEVIDFFKSLEIPIYKIEPHSSFGVEFTLLDGSKIWKSSFREFSTVCKVFRESRENCPHKKNRYFELTNHGYITCVKCGHETRSTDFNNSVLDRLDKFDAIVKELKGNSNG